MQFNFLNGCFAVTKFLQRSNVADMHTLGYPVFQGF